VDGTDSGFCLVAGFGVISIETLDLLLQVYFSYLYTLIIERMKCGYGNTFKYTVKNIPAPHHFLHSKGYMTH
jgi:hypothetical protein